MKFADRCAKLPTPQRRAIALLIAPLMVVMVIAALWLPIVHLHHRHAEWREEARRLLSLAEHAPAERAALQREITALNTSELWSRFYPGGQAVSSATSLHADIGALLSSVRVSVQSLTPIAAEESPQFTKVGIRFSASMRVNQLQGLMTAMALHSRYLRVERLLVAAPHVQSPDENPPLAVTMDVYGYELNEKAKPRQQEISALAMGGGH